MKPLFIELTSLLNTTILINVNDIEAVDTLIINYTENKACTCVFTRSSLSFNVQETPQFIHQLIGLAQ